jgi:hypothetical protein
MAKPVRISTPQQTTTRCADWHIGVVIAWPDNWAALRHILSVVYADQEKPPGAVRGVRPKTKPRTNNSTPTIVVMIARILRPGK